MRHGFQAAAATAALFLLAGCGGSGGGTDTANNAAAATGSDDGVVLTHDAAAGLPYAVPGPRKCSSQKSPASGAPSPETIAKYVICGGEGESGSNMYVIDKVMVTAVGTGRGYNANEDINMQNIDVNRQVFAIKGSYENYQCGKVMQPGGYDGGPDDHAGTNCNKSIEPNASGLCYVDTFGDWQCKMVDTDSKTNEFRNVAPPAA